MSEYEVVKNTTDISEKLAGYPISDGSPLGVIDIGAPTNRTEAAIVEACLTRGMVHVSSLRTPEATVTVYELKQIKE